MSRRAVWAAGGLLASIVVVFFFLSASTPRSAYAEESVTFFVVGDWGREGTFNQTKVATLMDDPAIVEKPRAVISGTAVGATAKKDWAGRRLTHPSQSSFTRSRSLSLSLSHICAAGDNFYDHGLNTSNDPLFERSFANVYNGPGLRHVPWFAVLGNHDYGDGLESGA